VQQPTESFVPNPPTSRPLEQPLLRVENVSKTFVRADGEPVRAIDSLSLDVFEGEMVVLLGPSGCGKTTLLRSLAGLEIPDEGEILLAGEALYSSTKGINQRPENRPIGMVFQNYALWPHMTVFENVAFSLNVKRSSKSVVEDEVAGVLGALNISDVKDQYPTQLSGGQQQRVALARALVAGDQVVLFDEPLSNIDAIVRAKLRIELLAKQRELGFTAVYVTHDQEEALSLATRVAVLREGQLEQYASPETVYYQPATRYVADFVGSANIGEGTIESFDSGSVVLVAEFGRATGQYSGSWKPDVGRVAYLVSRPEHWHLHPRDSFANESQDSDSVNRVGRIVTSMFTGGQVEYSVDVGDTHLRIRTHGRNRFDVGTEVVASCADFWVVPR
jgi:iron(III) transport system ATP-binding protein